MDEMVNVPGYGMAADSTFVSQILFSIFSGQCRYTKPFS
jgi:hypothetical protein